MNKNLEIVFFGKNGFRQIIALTNL